MGTFNYLSNDVSYNKVTQQTVTATGDIAEQDSSHDINCATDGLTLGLPLITSGNLGSTITFRNTGADANNTVVVSPKSTNRIVGSIVKASAVFSASGTLDKDCINTKATSKKGDYITLRAVTLTDWYIVGGVGIWASES